MTLDNVIDLALQPVNSSQTINWLLLSSEKNEKDVTIQLYLCKWLLLEVLTSYFNSNITYNLRWVNTESVWKTLLHSLIAWMYKKVLAQNKRAIWRLSDCNRTLIRDNLLNNLAKLIKWFS